MSLEAFETGQMHQRAEQPFILHDDEYLHHNVNILSLSTGVSSLTRHFNTLESPGYERM